MSKSNIIDSSSYVFSRYEDIGWYILFLNFNAFSKVPGIVKSIAIHIEVPENGIFVFSTISEKNNVGDCRIFDVKGKEIRPYVEK